MENSKWTYIVNSDAGRRPIIMHMRLGDQASFFFYSVDQVMLLVSFKYDKK